MPKMTKAQARKRLKEASKKIADALQAGLGYGSWHFDTRAQKDLMDMSRKCGQIADKLK